MKYLKFILLSTLCILFNQSLFSQSSSDSLCLQAGKLFHQAYLQLNSGQRQEALKKLEAAQIIAEANCPPSDSVRHLIYDYQGVIWVEKGFYSKAEAFFQKTLELREKYSPNRLGGSYFNMADLYLRMGEFNKARYYSRKSIERTMQRPLPIRNLFLALEFDFLGLTYYEEKDYGEALRFFNRADSLYAPFPVEYRFPFHGLVWYHIGNLYLLTEELDSATVYLKKSINFFERDPNANPEFRSGVLISLADVYHLAKKFDLSMELANDGIDLLTKIYSPNDPQISLGYNLKGRIFNKMEDWENALLYYNKAIQVFDFDLNGVRDYNRLANPEFLTAIINKATLLNSIFRKKKQDVKLLKEAEQYFSLADTLRQMLTLNLSSNAAKGQLIASFYLLSESWLENIYLQYEYSKEETLKHQFFQVLEKSKSSVLFEARRESRALQYGNIPKSLLSKEQLFREEISYLRQEIAQNLREGKDATDTLVLQLNNTLLAKQNQYDKLKKEFEEKHPKYFKLKYDYTPLSTQQARSELIASNQGILEYFVGDSLIYAILITDELLEIKEIKRDFPLATWIEQMRESINDYLPSHIPKYVEVAPQLYKKLLGPFREQLPNNLIIVPDGPLNQIPFDALLTGTPKQSEKITDYPFLLHKHQISYCYSANLLSMMKEDQSRDKALKTLVALAPFSQRGFQLESGEAYDSLSFSRIEVDSIIKLMEGTAFYDQDATKNLFLRIADSYQIIHLSTHGKLDHKNPNQNKLVFYPGDPNPKAYCLLLPEIYNIQLQADLVVFSACETGIGKFEKGEGLISIARAFAYAGAKSLITTLWEVADEHAKDLLIEFYCRLNNGQNKDKALRHAKLKLIKMAKTEKHFELAHPYFWSSFVNIGDMRPIK